jgi:hypothetical protein
MKIADHLFELAAAVLAAIYATVALKHFSPEAAFGAFFFLAFALFIRLSAAE